MKTLLKLRIFAILLVFCLLMLAAVSAQEITGNIVLEEGNIQDAAKESIRQKAQDVAKQIEIYMRSNPEMSVAELQKDAYFQSIAVQPVGKTGYTALTDYNSLICRFHKNPAIVNLDLSTLSGSLPGFWEIMSRTRGGKESEGVYDWQEADGSIRKKYMYIAVVNANTKDGIGLNVAATTYIDEFQDAGTDYNKIGADVALGITELLDEGVEDASSLAAVINISDPGKAREQMKKLIDSKSRIIWQNIGSDENPIDLRSTLPLYSGIMLLDLQGNELAGIIDNADMGIIEIGRMNSYKLVCEECFEESLAMNEGGVWISKVLTKYTPKQEVFENYPASDLDKYEIVVGRDTIKRGMIIFASPVYSNGVKKGILALMIDYRHLQETTKHVDPGSSDQVVSTRYDQNYVLVFDSLGNTIIHPKPDNILGYLDDGKIAGFNGGTGERAGAIFNLYAYTKSPSYPAMAKDVLVSRKTFFSTSTDVSGRTKTTIAVPIEYSNPRTNYAKTGIYGGVMLSIGAAKKEEKIEELAIKLNAKSVADEVDSYLEENPEKTIRDLQDDDAFRKIAVQKVGDTGYTALIDTNSGYFYFHPQRQKENTDAHLLKDKLPDWWKIFERTIGPECEETSGYYDWIEADGSVQQKYMHLACVKQKTADGKMLFVAATAYTDEISAVKYLEMYKINPESAFQSIRTESTSSLEILSNNFGFWANEMNSRFEINKNIPAPAAYALDILKKSKFRNTDDFEKEFAVFNGAWRTNVGYFREAYGTEDIAGVIIYSYTNLTPENKKAMLQLQQDTKIYADAVKVYFDNFYFMFDAGYYSMYPKEWIFEDEHNDTFKEDLWYYIADPLHNPERKSVWTPTYYDAVLGQWMVSLITPIYFNNTFYGIAGGDVPLEGIFDEISKANFNGNGYAMIFDTDKNIVIHPYYLDEITKSGEMEELFTLEDIKQKELSKQIEKIGNERGVIGFTENGIEQILLYQKLDNINWYYAFVIDTSLLEKEEKVIVLPQKSYLLIAGALGVIMAALMLLVKTGIIKIENNAVLMLLAATLSIIIGLFVYNTYLNTQSIIDDKITSTVSELYTTANAQEHHINHITANLIRNAEITAAQQDLSLDELIEIKTLSEYYQEVFVLDSAGVVTVSSDQENIGRLRPQFIDGSNSDTSITFTKTPEVGYSVSVSTPFHNGVLVFLTDINEIDGLSYILQDTTQTGESLIAYRCNQSHAEYITEQRFSGVKSVPLDAKITMALALQGNEMSYTDARDYRNVEVIAVTRYIEALDTGLVVKIDKDEALGKALQTTNTIWIFAIGIIISILVTGIVFYYLLTKSLRGTISGKTAELQKNIKELEETKAAVMNIMEDLSAANSDLKKLDEAKSNFLNIISHELKTPLTAMLAHTEVLDDSRSSLSPQQHSSIDAVKRNCNQLRMLIENILEIARIESNKFQLIITKVDVNRVIMESVTNLRILAENKGIKLEQDIEKLPFIHTDEIRLKEILNNLISNAIKFTEKGGIKVMARKDKHFVKVQVSDTGIGIPKQKMDELFTKFYQVDASLSRRYGGTGLGLSITKQLVELMGGTITVESVEGKGSVFSFTLPVGGKNEKNTVR